MTTTRTVRAAQQGPALIRTNLSVLDLTVLAERGRTHAELTISTPDDTGPSADAVNRATLTANGTTLEARVSLNAGGGGMTITQTGRRGTSFSSVNISGGSFVISGGGSVTVNGQTINLGGGGPGTVISAGGPITVIARVPEGSSVNAASVSGDVETSGQLAEVTATTTSGDIVVEATNRARLHTVSGDLSIDNLTGTADLHSTSGDISVEGPRSARVRANTVSGDVRGRGVDLDAHTVSGRVRNR